MEDKKYEQIKKYAYLQYKYIRDHDRFFSSSYYRWRIGSKLFTQIIDNVDAFYRYSIDSLNEVNMLYGIEIDIDYMNQYIFKIYKDITLD